MLSVQHIKKQILAHSFTPLPESPKVCLADQLACAQRELAFRTRTYALAVAERRMSPEQATRETEAMAAIVVTLTRDLLLEQISEEIRSSFSPENYPIKNSQPQTHDAAKNE